MEIYSTIFNHFSRTEMSRKNKGKCKLLSQFDYHQIHTFIIHKNALLEHFISIKFRYLKSSYDKFIQIWRY